jgi:hypothetical protein
MDRPYLYPLFVSDKVSNIHVHTHALCKNPFEKKILHLFSYGDFPYDALIVEGPLGSVLMH